MNKRALGFSMLATASVVVVALFFTMVAYLYDICATLFLVSVLTYIGVAIYLYVTGEEQ